MLRISSGRLRGRKILAPEGELKPTSDKVRQALFNMFRPHIFGARFLDLFAGSGSVGITALSEGAEHASFVENDPRTFRALKQNIMDLEIPADTYELHRADALGVSLGQGFDLVFADPFYPDIHPKFVKGLHGKVYALLSEGGIFVLEHSSKLHSEDLALEGFRESKRYGDTTLTLFSK